MATKDKMNTIMPPKNPNFFRIIVPEKKYAAMHPMVTANITSAIQAQVLECMAFATFSMVFDMKDPVSPFLSTILELTKSRLILASVFVGSSLSARSYAKIDWDILPQR